MSDQKFFICSHCGNIVGLIQEAGVPMICCGEKMEELVPNTVDAAQEKHVPDVTIDGDTIKIEVGSVEHPMVDEHYIQWIYLQTENGGQRKSLKPGDKPSATFSLVDDKAIATFEYCNLHGLWKADIK